MRWLLSIATAVTLVACDGDDQAATPTTRVDAATVAISGVLYHNDDRTLLCDPSSRSLCSVGIVVDGASFDFNQIATEVSVAGRRSSGVVTLQGSDSANGFVTSYVDVGSATPIWLDESMESFFSDGLPIVQPADLFVAPMCGGNLNDHPEAECEQRTFALGLNPLASELIDREGDVVTLSVTEVGCASGGAQADRRRVVVPTVAEGSLVLVPLIAPLNGQVTCEPNTPVEIRYVIPSEYSDLQLAVPEPLQDR